MSVTRPRPPDVSDHARDDPMINRPLRVAVLGAGTVGGPVVRAFLERPERLRPVDGRALELAGVADRDFDGVLARLPGLSRELLTDAPAQLIASDDVDAVVELMGGEEPAHTLIAAALAAGKAVVTANKHVIAHHGAEFEDIARRTGAALRFEAAVGGGIPLLGPLGADLATNEIRSIEGIVNGTTNYILSAMAEDGRAYEDVLAAAQRAGYAEADPRGDVEGDDAVNKIVILARLGFGTWLRPSDVARTSSPEGIGRGLPGIAGITLADVRRALQSGRTIRLIARAARRPDGAIEASVLPAEVAAASPFGRTSGVLNRIEIEAVPLGMVAFEGPGAGGDATASAVLADLVAIARGGGSTWAGLAPAVESVARALRD